MGKRNELLYNLEQLAMKIIRLPRGEFEKKYPHEAGTHYTTEGGEHIVEVPYGASTKSIMHEIAHAELGHISPVGTYGEVARRELDADAWVYEKLGRSPSHYEVLADFVPMVEELVDRGYSVNQIFSWVKGEVEDAGYPMERDDRSRIWWLVRGIYDCGKEK